MPWHSFSIHNPKNRGSTQMAFHMQLYSHQEATNAK